MDGIIHRDQSKQSSVLSTFQTSSKKFWECTCMPNFLLLLPLFENVITCCVEYFHRTVVYVVIDRELPYSLVHLVPVLYVLLFLGSR